jgi:hypothetical protein
MCKPLRCVEPVPFLSNWQLMKPVQLNPMRRSKPSPVSDSENRQLVHVEKNAACPIVPPVPSAFAS